MKVYKIHTHDGDILEKMSKNGHKKSRIKSGSFCTTYEQWNSLCPAGTEHNVDNGD